MIYNVLNSEIENFVLHFIHDLPLFLEKLSLITPGNFSLFLIDDDGIRELNKQYRNNDKTTDVLSFPMDLNSVLNNDDELYLGEIIVNPYEIERKSIVNKESFNELFAYMIIHSYLHLKGYTHNTEDEYTKIESLAEDMLRRFAVL